MRDAATKPRIEREAEIRALAQNNGRRLMGDGHYSTVMLGWSDIQMLLGEIDRLREALRPIKPMEGDAV